MKIKEIRQDNSLTVELEGRLDTTSAPDLQTVLERNYPSLTGLVLDFEKVQYMSSAGVRVVLMAHKKMTDKGGVVIRHPNQLVLKVLELTGVDSFLTIEK